MLHQPGKELTVMQGQFLLQRVPPVGGVLIVTVTERDVLVFHRRDFIFAQARPIYCITCSGISRGGSR